MSENSKPPPATDSQPAADDGRQEREERILSAAATLLVRWGYRKTTIDDVAREAGVGKGTIYLHWKDKKELFRAAIWHAQQRAAENLKRRIAADPAGGLFHRLIMHSMLASLDDPLLAAIQQGRADIIGGVMDAYDAATLNKMASDFDAYMIQLQEAGLIRSDIPIPVATFLLTALKIGLIHTPALLGEAHTPAMAELRDGISDLVHRWLEPEDLPAQSERGKQLSNDLIDQIEHYDQGHQRSDA